jgi:hypothetical protein
MARRKQRRIQRSGEDERIIKPKDRKPDQSHVDRPDGALVPHPTAGSLNHQAILQMQQEKGNAHTQKTLDGQDRLQRAGENSEGLVEVAEVPGVRGASEISLVGDILTVLDTGLTLTDIAAGAAGAAFVDTVFFTTLAGSLGMAGSLLFMVGGLFAMADAYQSGNKWGAMAHGMEPPAAPSSMGPAEAFDEAAAATKQKVQARAKKGKKSAAKITGALLSLSRLEPELALNAIYSQLVYAKLQSTFLGFQTSGGSLFKMAKSYWLMWPRVDGYYLE